MTNTMNVGDEIFTDALFKLFVQRIKRIVDVFQRGKVRIDDGVQEGVEYIVSP